MKELDIQLLEELQELNSEIVPLLNPRIRKICVNRSIKRGLGKPTDDEESLILLTLHELLVSPLIVEEEKRWE